MKDKLDLKAINQQLKAQGRRICPCCGRNLPLNAEHYYPKRNKKGLWTRWSGNCRECVKAKTREWGRERYRKDKTYRKYKAEYRRAYFAKPENRERHRARCRIYIQTKRREQRRAHFTAVLTRRRVTGRGYANHARQPTSASIDAKIAMPFGRGDERTSSSGY